MIWVIFEGPDGAGKSSAARRLVGMLADTRNPGGAPTVLQHLNQYSKLEEYTTPPRMWGLSGMNVVQDRHLISDLVYAPVMGNGASRLGEAEVRKGMIEIARRAVVIHMTASEEVLRSRIEVRGDDLIQGDQLHAICKNYFREMSWWQHNGALVHTFDTSEDFPTDEELIFCVSSLLQDLKNRRT